MVLRVGDVVGGALRVYEAVLESNLDGNTPRKHHRAFIQNTNLADTISPIWAQKTITGSIHTLYGCVDGLYSLKSLYVRF